jgi:hypothetical protein
MRPDLSSKAKSMPRLTSADQVNSGSSSISPSSATTWSGLGLIPFVFFLRADAGFITHCFALLGKVSSGKFAVARQACRVPNGTKVAPVHFLCIFVLHNEKQCANIGT